MFIKESYQEKIYEHRRVFLDEPITVYLYMSTLVKAITEIMHLNNKVQIVTWKEKYSKNIVAVKRIDEYLKTYIVTIEICDFQKTNTIPLKQLRKDIPGFVVSQMYYYLEESPLLKYLEQNLITEGEKIYHDFSSVVSSKYALTNFAYLSKRH